MAAELMVINPIRRRHKRRKSTPKRRASSRRRRVTRVRRNPIALPFGFSSGGRKVRRRRRSRGRIRAVARRSYRRISSTGMGGFVTGKLLPAAIGAGGALALDMAWGYLPIPDTLKSGPLAPLARIAGAVGIGMAVRAIAGKRMGEEAMNGAITVTLYDLAKGYMTVAAPSATGMYVGGLGYSSAAQNAGMNSMGMYVG